MTKSEFTDWKRHPVTQQVFSQLQARVQHLTEQLVEQTSYLEPRTLASMAGSIAAYKDMLLIDYEETE